MIIALFILGLVILLALCVLIGFVARLAQRKDFDPAHLPPAATPEALNDAERRLNEQFEASRRANAEANSSQRQELNLLLKGSSEALTRGVERLGESSQQQIRQVHELVAKELPLQVERTVKQRFTDDFTLVKEALEQVSQRLTTLERLDKGVDTLSGSVARFSQMLGNVKARGTWGEYQLGSILADILAPGQYEQNVHPNPRAHKRVVEFAIALPGQNEGEQVWLPIDSKFPQEDYERLIEAANANQQEAVEAASKALIQRVKKFATEVRDAYIYPPYTTDFAILFLPTEGLYLELLRHPGVADEIQRQSKVLLAGPMTLGALLSALRLGFRTLAVQRNTVDVMKTLQRVKQALEGFESQHANLLKNLQNAVSATEKEASRLSTLKKALASVESESTETTIDEEETSKHA